MMKGTKQKKQQQKYQASQQQQKYQQKKLSQCRDYISMKAFHNMSNNKKKPIKKVQKHSKVHAHLQPQIPEGQQAQVSEQQFDRDGDPTALLANFNNQNYNEWIKVMKERIVTQKPYTQQHPQLLDALAITNTNICVYGYGSKIDYLRDIVFEYLGDHYIWQVNGYKASINDKKIYNNFGKFLIEAGVASKIDKITKQQQLQQYRQYLNSYAKSYQKQLIVLFHCIDSINFLDCDSQVCLSQLFSLPNIRLICSIDNMKIASIWHPTVKTQYKFTFFNINTSVPYIHEQIFRPNTNDNRDMQQKAIMNIYQSLNNNQKRILKLFAKRQLQNDNKQQPEYFTFDSLLDECIDNIILSNDMQLRENLLELLDHKVIVAADKKDGGAKKYYTIKCNKAMLDKIYKQKIQD